MTRPYVDGKAPVEWQTVDRDTFDRYLNGLSFTTKTDFGSKNFLTIRYEDLIADSNLIEVKKICRQLNIPLKETSAIFMEKSLFGQQKPDGEHIRSGKTQQWKTEFNRCIAEEFASLHQGSLETLGYETDTSWIDQFKG